MNECGRRTRTNYNPNMDVDEIGSSSGEEEDDDEDEDMDALLHDACITGDHRSVSTLLSYGADVNATNSQGATCLQSAVHNNHVDDVMTALLDAAADVNQTDTERGISALHVAAARNHEAAARLLLERGANAESRCALGTTPFEIAEWFGSLHVVRLLRRHNCAAGIDQLISTADVVGHSTVAATSSSPDHPPALPEEFAAQATQLALPLRRLIVDGVDPATVPAAAVVHSLRMSLTQFRRARAALAPPADEILLRVPSVLDPSECARLRAAVDAGAATQPDSVDGLADHQLDCHTIADLERLCAGTDGAEVGIVDRLERLADRFLSEERRAAATLGTARSALRIRQAFIRRYTPSGRPWFNFHQDTGPLTVNIALADDRAHHGGTLLALYDGRVRAIERQEGEATVHPSALLHGVSRIRGGVRYSLIVFWGGSEKQK